MSLKWKLSKIALFTSLAAGALFPEQPTHAATVVGKAKATRGRASDLSTLTYHLSIPAPETQYVEVRMQVPKRWADNRKTVIAIPAWAPGSYLIRDFGRHVYNVQAVDGSGKTLHVSRDSKQQWTVHNEGRAFAVKYEVFAAELSVRTSFVDNKLGLINGSSIFMYLPTAKDASAKLHLELPTSWHAYTSLPLVDENYWAPSYDVLVDSPLLLGQAQQRHFIVDKTQFHYVIAAPSGTNANIDRLAHEAQLVVEAFAKMMGGIDFGDYTFLTVLDDNGGGGLEHLNSTAMILRPFRFHEPDGYHRAQSLVAHEFFHAWNVKRIRDAQLGPFDYEKEVYTDLLWFHEGFTETMESRSLLLAGRFTSSSYLDDLAKKWADYIEHPGRNHTPIAQLSRDAWIKFYRSAPNLRNTSISYYTKGDLIGVCLDLSIRYRAALQGRNAGLDSMFASMWKQRDKDGHLRITKDDIVAAASREAGYNMQDFFDRYVYGTEELPLPELLSQLGIDVQKEIKRDAMGRPVAYVGASMSGPTIRSIDPDSPAALAKLMPDDEIVAIEDHQWRSGESFEEQLVSRRSGERIRVSYFRRGRLEHTLVRPVDSPHRSWSFRREADAKLAPEILRARSAWLNETNAEPNAQRPSANASR